MEANIDNDQPPFKSPKETQLIGQKFNKKMQK